MPILDDIMDHEVLGRERKRGIALGRAEGQAQRRAEGLAEGRAEGERLTVLRQITKRFRPVPNWAKESVDALSAADLERIALRLLDGGSLEDLFK